jgi:hypothetical protein
MSAIKVFSAFQVMHSGCCTVAAHLLHLKRSESELRPAKVEFLYGGIAAEEVHAEVAVALEPVPRMCSSFHRSNQAFQGGGSR